MILVQWIWCLLAFSHSLLLSMAVKKQFSYSLMFLFSKLHIVPLNIKLVCFTIHIFYSFMVFICFNYRFLSEVC